MLNEQLPFAAWFVGFPLIYSNVLAYSVYSPYFRIRTLLPN